MEIIERAGMIDSKPYTSLVDAVSKLSSNTSDPVSDPTHYHSLADTMSYLSFTHPDISYMVQYVYLQMHDPREPHMTALKSILCYL
jgi:hypothetical protein